MSGSRKTVFNYQWLDKQLHPEFSEWLTSVARNKHQAYCKVCSKTIELSNMGLRSITSHHNGPTHLRNLQCKMSQQSISKLLPKKNAADEPQAALAPINKDLPIQKIPNNETATTGSNGTLTNFVLSEDVTKAECLWALQVIEKNMSYNSCSNASSIFKEMFSDSKIALSFQLSPAKLAYSVSYGLAPYFHDLLFDYLKTCEDFVISFDESLNKVVQRGQMDQVIRYWDVNSNRVATRYYNSVFLNQATADDLLDKFKEGMGLLPVSNILQVSMDGPNVNLSFISKLKHELAQGKNDEKKQLLDLGTCGLHVVHGAFKTALNAAGWDLNTFLRHLYYLFKDSPSRRGSYTKLTGSSVFPLRFCATRWVENVKCADRAILVYDHVKKFVNETKIANSKPLNSVKTAVKDPLMKSKLAFFRTVGTECEPFLRKFQSPLSLVPYLYGDLSALVRSLMVRCVQEEKLKDASTGSKLAAIDLTKEGGNLVDSKNVNIGFQASKLLRESNVSELAKREFLSQCRAFLVSLLSKILEKSPLKFRLVRGLSALDPELIAKTSKLVRSRMKEVLGILHNANRISHLVAEKAKRQYSELCDEAKGVLKDEFNTFVDEKEGESIGLDAFYAKLLSNKPKYLELWTVVKLSLIFAHGNASVESGFSINKSLLIENLHEETLVNQRRVYDSIKAVGGVEKIVVDRKMIKAFRGAHKRYKDQMEAKKCLAASEEKKRLEKKQLDKEIQRLEGQKKRVRREAQLEESAIDQEVHQLKQKKQKL